MQKKFLTKFNTHFWEKITLPKVDTEGIYRNIIKAIYDKPTANIILSGKKLETLPLIRTKTKKSTLTTTVQHSLEVLVMAIREEKEKKKKSGVQVGKRTQRRKMKKKKRNPGYHCLQMT